MNYLSHFSRILFLTFGIGLTACQSDGDLPLDERGGISVRLENVSSAVVSRSTPAVLGKPIAERFTLTVSDSHGAAKYSGNFTDEIIHLPAGTYSVAASCGDNPLIALDAPYYCGATTVDVAGETVSEVSVACSVGNALVSVVFGQNEEERARFDKFYTNYGVTVKVGEYAARIPNTDAGVSAYFRAGSSPVLEFSGTLRDNGRKVSTLLDTSRPGFPSVFQAADHAILTLTLPDPESATVLDISKVEVTEATLDESIPLSWLPLPRAVAEHQYDADGNLVGTDITFSNCYPGMEWKAVVTDADGATFRTVQGTGTLTSGHTQQDQSWVYVPAGTYSATYYLMVDGEPQKTGSRDFTVGNPHLTASVEGYTSYSKYLAGDVDGANACDGRTVYGLKSHVNVAAALLADSRYAKSVTTTLGGSALTGTRRGSDYDYGNHGDVTPSFDPCRLACTATFDCATASASKDLYVTGLPASFAPPSQSAGWSGHGTVAWDDSDNGVARIRLGQNTVSQPQYVQYDGFAIPRGTKVECPYRVAANGATVQTTLTLTLGDYEYFSFKTSYMKLSPFEDTAVFTTSADVTSAKANNSYGSGQTKSFIYYLNYKYAK